MYDPGLIYPLIEASETTQSCGEFLMHLGMIKSSLHESFASESLRIMRFLQDFAGSRAASSIPYSGTRTLLSKIWCQVENSIPPHLLKEGKIMDLCLRWLENSPTGSGVDRSYLIRLLKNQKEPNSTDIQFDLKLISLFFDGVMRSTKDTGKRAYYPENIQLVLPLVDHDALGICLYALLENASMERILHMWALILTMAPLSPSQEGIKFSKFKFDGSNYPIFSFANVFIRVAAKLGSSSHPGPSSYDWRTIVETMLRMVACKLSEPVLIPDACELLIYLLKIEVPGRTLPSFLLAGMNREMIPVVESILSFAETVFNRLTMGSSMTLRDPNIGRQLEFLSSLIRILQEDISVVKSGHMFAMHAPKTALSLNLPTGALEIARLQSIGARPQIMSATASVLPPDTAALMQPLAPLQGVAIPTQALVAPVVLASAALTTYPTGQGVEVAPKPDKFSGIQNFNNTCYLSSFLQLMFLTDGFLASVYAFSLQKLEKMEDADFDQGSKIVTGLQLLFARLLKTQHKYIEISEFIRSLPPSYRSGEQQDVTESGRWLFDKMGGTDQSLVKSVFGGEMIHKTKCLGCNNITERKEVFTDLCVSVPKQAEVLGKKKVTVQSLIKRLFKPESMTGDNKYSCEPCGKKQDASRWIEITQLPNHLMLVMHKFSFDIATCDFKKETTPVHPESGSIDLIGTQYDLYGSILHYGESAMKGHYVALGKRSSQTGSRWALMDDSTVTMLSTDEAMERLSGLHKPTDSAYVLFFKSARAPPAPNPRMPQQLLDEALAIEAAAVHL
jgi:ubiquitin C-terminal hydrolase